MKKKLIVGGAILIVIGLLITITVVKTKNAGAFGGKALDVKVVSTKIQNINATVPVSGIVEEADKEEIYFDTAIKITNLYVKKDDYVKKGQKLVDFDTDSLNSELSQAQINLNIQKITLNKMEDSSKIQYNNQIKSLVEQAKNAMEQAKTNFERVEKLYNQGAASYVEYQNAKVQYENANLQYISSQNNSNDLTGASGKDIENQKNQIKLTELRINDLRTKINKLAAQSICPIDGVITELNIQKGGITTPGVMAIKIINPNFLQVKLEVKEVNMLKVKVGQVVDVTGDAFPDKILKGVVKSVGTVATKKQGVSNSDEAFIQVVVSVDNTEKILKPGISVNAEIITDTRVNAVTIPFNAFQEDKNGKKWVFVVENNIAKQVNITTGISAKLDLEVTSGLKGNEKIVEDPPSNLKDGMKVTVQG